MGILPAGSATWAGSGPSLAKAERSMVGHRTSSPSLASQTRGQPGLGPGCKFDVSYLLGCLPTGTRSFSVVFGCLSAYRSVTKRPSSEVPSLYATSSTSPFDVAARGLQNRQVRTYNKLPIVLSPPRAAPSLGAGAHHTLRLSRAAACCRDSRRASPQGCAISASEADIPPLTSFMATFH